MEDLIKYFVLLRNEIYARHGYIFKDKALKEFFGKMAWYKPEKEKIEFQKEFHWRERSSIEDLQHLEKAAEEGIRWAEKQELLTKEVIINAPWGKGKGEFALEPLPESREYMTRFTVGTNGDFYILDPNNQRINIFSKEGRFLRSISIPSVFIYNYEGEKTSLVEGIGVDSKGNIYLASSSVVKNGEIIIKMDRKGNVIEEYKFKGRYTIPDIIEDESGRMLLWGRWNTGYSASDYTLIPLEVGKGEGIEVTDNFLYSQDIKPSLFPSTKAFGDGYPIEFTKRDNKIAGFTGGYVVFGDANGRVKEKIPIYLERDEKWGVIVRAPACFDKDFNIYFIDGTPEGLHVIKFTPKEEVWK